MVTLEETHDNLVSRLEPGFEAIEERRKTAGKIPANWEDEFIKLLRQYENVCNQIKERDNARKTVTAQS